MKENKKMGSFCVHELQDKRTTKPHQLPIYATSSFEFENIDQGIDIFSGKEKGHVYSRYGNPTIEVVAEKIARLEAFGLDIDPKGMLFSSGMSAISTLIMATLEKGDKILSQGNLYGGTTELFAKIFSSFGIDLIMMDLHDLEKVEETIKSDPGIKMLYFETPANPSLACVDIQGLADIAQRYNRFSAIDNTFCTPYLQQPFKYGVDFIIHSTTKYLNGHGNSIAGAIVGKNKELMDTKIWQAMKLVGTNCNPWDAWLTNNGIKTLELRMDRHSANAQAVAEYLKAHPSVIKVNYPGLVSHPDHEIAKKQMTAFGGMLSFEIDGGLESGIEFMNKIKLCVLAPTLGDVDTLILHPASMSHLNIPKEVRLLNGITDGLIRVSIGIENVEDIIADLENALE
jgi:methionine-gamma-lyase